MRHPTSGLKVGNYSRKDNNNNYSAMNKTRTTFENYIHKQFEDEVDSDEIIIDNLLNVSQ